MSRMLRDTLHALSRFVSATADRARGVLPTSHRVAAQPRPIQPLPILAGVAGGLAAGGWTSIGMIVAQARMGNFLFDAQEVVQIRLETVSLLLFPILGGLIGSRSADRLKATAAGAGLGAIGGAFLGIGVGAWAGDTSEARWAGGIIGSALGVLIGGAIGGSTTFLSSGRSSRPASQVDRS